MLRVFETQFVGYFAHGFAGVENLFLGHVDHFGLDVILCRTAGFFFDKIAYLIGREDQLPGALRSSEQPRS